MRTLLIIFLVLIILVMFGMIVKNNIEVSVKFASFNIDGFMKSLLEKKPTIKVGAAITVHNTNFFAIPVSDLDIKVYDEDILIAQSIGISEKLIIPAEQFKTFTHSFDVFISTLLLDKIKKVQTGQKIKFTYEIRGKVFGQSVRFKNQYNSLV